MHSGSFYVTECPKGFVSGIYGLQCYLFGSESKTWFEGQEFCESKNAYLAELKESDERNAVFNYAKGEKTNLSEKKEVNFSFFPEPFSKC